MDVMYVNYFNATDMIHAVEACVDGSFCPRTLEEMRWKVRSVLNAAIIYHLHCMQLQHGEQYVREGMIMRGDIEAWFENTSSPYNRGAFQIDIEAVVDMYTPYVESSYGYQYDHCGECHYHPHCCCHISLLPVSLVLGSLSLLLTVC